MEFRVLGPLEVVAGDGAAVAVGGSRERAVLVRLLLSANQVVATETLADDLWVGEPPEGAAQALWVYLSRLRKALRDHGGDHLLVTKSPGYLLAVDPAAVDSARFETLVGSARHLASAGDRAEAAVRFREALSLWRGQALAEVADMPFAQAEASRLEEARLAAVEGRIDADLACGRHGELVGELAALTRDHPLRERFWAHRMLALYRTGRQAEALRAYQDLRRYLGEELGIEPSEDLRRLEGAVLRHQPEVDWQPPEPVAGAPQPEPGSAAEPAPVPGVVAFLFTDLVDSTELLTELGDDAADELRRCHFTELRHALSAHGGTEVKTLGDGLMAAFPSPVAAVRCAVAIQQPAGDVGSERGPSLAVRVGVHAGEPIRDGDDYFGTPVVIAQRLCSRARAGQILASALVQGLVGNRAECLFRGLGGLALKGLPEPVAACEVLPATPAEPKTLPLPLPLERDDSSAFVGREPEMAHLIEAWREASAGRHRLALVAGEPGIGKTRLAAELARLAHDEGGAVLFGRCAEGMAIPYRPVLEALTGYLRDAPDPVLGSLGGELARLVPELPERFPALPPPMRSDPETERYRLFDAVAAWLADVSAETPAVLVVDDLHWATRPTLELLTHLVRSAVPLRLLILATYRDTDLDVTAELADAVAELLRQPGVERLRLHGLDPAGVSAFVAAQARHDLGDAGRELATTLYAETGGNPFFVTQLLRHLGETGAVVRHAGRRTTETLPTEFAVPESVRDVITRRLARLPDETHEVLAQAAILGEHFDLAVLVNATGHAEIATLRALDPALAARLVTEAPGPVPAYQFVHALVRATLSDTLPAADRVHLHQRAGAAIEAVHGAHLDEHLPALAHHYARAGLTHRVLGATYATQAGHRALAQYANDDAAAWYQQALDLLDQTGDADQNRRCDLLIALGEAQHRAGDPTGRDTLLAAAHLAQDLDDPERLARAALVGYPGPMVVVFDPYDPERTDVIKAALAAVGPEDSPLRARLLATMSAELANSPRSQERHRPLAEAIAMARRLRDPATLARVLILGTPSFVEFRFDAAEHAAWRNELAAAGRELGDPTLTFWAGFAEWASALMAQDLHTANVALDGVQRLADEVGQPLLCWMATMLRSVQSRMAGRLEEAEALARAALELGSSARRPGAARRLFRAQLLWIRYDQGRTTDLLDSFVRSVGREGARSWTRALLSLIYCELDRLDDARPLFDALAHEHFAAVDYPWIHTLAVLARVCADLGDIDRAAALYDELGPHHALALPQGYTILDPVAYFLGLLATTLGRYDRAEDHFVEAAAVADRMEAPTWLARTRLEWARMLLRRAGPGDPDQARELAGAALASAEELGMARVAAQAREVLAVSGRNR